MARRHFEKNGFPRLDIIVGEIRDYIASFRVEYTHYPRGNIVYPYAVSLLNYPI